MTEQDATSGTDTGAIVFRLMHELEGLLLGIRADGRVDGDELALLVRWVDAAEPFATRPPFTELVQVVRAVVQSGVMTSEQIDDLLFVTGKLTRTDSNSEAIRGGLQQLHGVLAAITADGAIDGSEVTALRRWIDEWSHLKGFAPYDECAALATAALSNPADMVPAMAALLEMAQQLPAGAVDPTEPLTIRGVFATDPDIQFAGREFVFTGRSPRSSPEELQRHVLSRGGRVAQEVSEQTDYLIASTGDCPYWAFSCYGRKVEEALKLRRAGRPIVIVDERDFWDALN